MRDDPSSRITRIGERASDEAGLFSRQIPDDCALTVIADDKPVPIGNWLEQKERSPGLSIIPRDSPPTGGSCLDGAILRCSARIACTRRKRKAPAVI